jgi:uncharacterized protein YbjT (DUF2867 family)
VIPRQIAVTGATGFTGAFVVRALRQGFPDARIRCLVRPSSRCDGLREARAEVAVGDLRDPASLRAAFDGADTLVNVASLGFDWIDPLFEAVRESRLERGVFLGTTAILTRLPVKSRAMRVHGEALVRSSGLDWTIVRPTMIYGTPSDRNIARLIRFVLRSPVVPVVAPHAIQQPVHVADVAGAVVSALSAPAASRRAYNIAGRDPLPMEALVRTVIRGAGLRRLVVRVPSVVLRLAVSLYGRLAAHPALTIEQVERLHEHKGFDYSDAARDLAFAPRSFEEGIRSEIEMILAGRTR